ncbi:WYL domain-containing protein [Salinivibrio kushneri]|uniref:WYL domain-containing protein n=1 Tax=Salinivibrio kushneri TaxID=1908198 RepID=UPI000989751A|nr:WYL domain-containing protein [Salinivibrio kushneri]OOE64971.1 hypothetical protein BZG19_14060 [Salinivibrio kushneri]
MLDEANSVENRRPSVALILGIIILPFVFVWFLLGRTYTSKARIIGFGYLSFLGILLLLPSGSNHEGTNVQSLVGFILWCAIGFGIYKLICLVKSKIASLKLPPSQDVKPAKVHRDIDSSIPHEKPLSEKDESKARAIARWEKTLTTLWEGSTADVSFDYTDSQGERSHREISPTKLCVNDKKEQYLFGICHAEGEERSFKVARIEKVFSTGKRYSFEDWCFNLLELDVASPTPQPSRPPRKKRSTNSGAFEITFTGLPEAEKMQLSEMAEEAGMVVRKSVTKNLNAICYGGRASAAKLEKAQAQGAFVITPPEFEQLLETGEIE